MIILAQLAWIIRVLTHKRLGSYLRGFGEALRLAPAMIRARAAMRMSWKRSVKQFWREIIKSELSARGDFTVAGNEPRSTFLRWYFRIF
jgi:hypothetical protein